MSGDPNVLYDVNHLDVLRRHVRDESIDLVYGVSSDPWWQEVTERAFGWSWATTTWGCRWPIPTTVRVVTAWGRTA